MDKIEIKISADGTKIYAPLVIKWLKCTPEEKVRQEFICRLVNDYGYSLAQMEQELNLTERSKRGTGAARADIVVWANADDKGNRKSALIVVECKAPNVTLHREDCFQGFNYAAWSHAKFFVITNQKETHFYKMKEETIPQFTADLEDFSDIPNAQQALDYIGRIFSFIVPEGLLSRDKETDKLFDRILNHRFFNLIGIGGSGKSSLTYLMYQKYKNAFNEIAYIVINNNIKEEIVSKINGTLDILKKDEDNKFEKIIAYLTSHFDSQKPNLLILDINETSDNEANQKCVKELKTTINNWNVLIISREQFRGIETLNLNETEDYEFLKDLFLDKAGKEKYKGFGQFADLFKLIYYSPIWQNNLACICTNFRCRH